MKIAFASCSNIKMQKDNQPIWGIIHGQEPDLLILLGDNVYVGKGDSPEETLEVKYKRLEDKYKRQLAEPHFNKLLCDVPYLAIWDNHDFGTDALTFGDTVTDEEKDISRDLFYRYLKYRSVVPYSVVADRNEIYCTYTKDDVKFIMLDVRSYQQEPGDDNTLLGKDQEKWLLDEMGNSTGITVICSGISYSYNQRGWSDYKNWFDKFNRKVAGTSKPLFLGGSIHKNFFKHHIVSDEPIIKMRKLSPSKIRNRPPTPWGTNFYEIISSSIGRNMGVHSGGPPHNKYGIIDIKTSEVEITLYSQQPNNFIHRVININNWELED